MEDNRSVIERLDDIEGKQKETQEQNEQILNLLNSIGSAAENKNNQNVIVENSQHTIARFIKRSKKESIWFGSAEDFGKEKSRVFIISWITVILSFMTSIVTALSCGFFSVASIFEIWWSILIVSIMIKRAKTEKIMDLTDLALMSCEEYTIDRDGVPRNTMREYGIYKWSRILSYIAMGCNICVIFAFVRYGWLTAIAVILELGFLGFDIASHYFLVDFDCMYDSYYIFTGMNDSKTEEVKLVADLVLNKLMTYEEFKRLFGDYIS